VERTVAHAVTVHDVNCGNLLIPYTKLHGRHFPITYWHCGAWFLPKQNAPVLLCTQGRILLVIDRRVATIGTTIGTKELTPFVLSNCDRQSEPARFIMTRNDLSHSLFPDRRLRAT
jgi:hypothetical protein